MQCFFNTSVSSHFVVGKWQTWCEGCLPAESIEILPYDDETTPSVSIPKFSSVINGETKLYKWVTGARTGQYLLFNHLSELGVSTNKNLEEYGSYAVSNADIEHFILYQLTGIVALYSVELNYFKGELNINYINSAE